MKTRNHGSWYAKLQLTLSSKAVTGGFLPELVRFAVVWAALAGILPGAANPAPNKLHAPQAAQPATAMPQDLKLALENARYRIEPDASAAGYRADNDANRFSVKFSGTQTIIDAGQGAQTTLSLAGYGWGRAELRAVGPLTHVESSGKRLDRHYGSALSEWFLNTAQGLEQGFKLAQRDAAANGALRIRLSAAGGWRVSEAGDSIRLARDSVTLTYSHLRASDANGSELVSRLRAVNHEIELEIEDAGAVYPLTVDPTFAQQPALTAADGAQFDQFGYAVALSSDGNTALVSANNRGTVYVFTRSGANWSLQQELTASDAANGDSFGWSVALSSDGNTALIGAIGKNSYKGAAYVFTRSGTNWSQQQELTAGDAANGDWFGYAVALSSDGSTALAGAYNKNSSKGAAYVFTRAGTNWSQQQELTAGDAANGDLFGSSAALSSDGNTALVGASNKNSGQGAGYVFTRAGTSWSQQQELTASDAANGDHFGTSAALSSDGNTAVVGAYEKNSGQGAGYVFTRAGTSWSQQQELTASDAANKDYFGSSAALSSDGNTALLAAGNKGAVYVFARAGTSWSQKQKLTASDGGTFGTSVALSGDGSTALVGASGRNSGQGVAYPFQLTQTFNQQQELTAGDAANSDLFGSSVALSSDGNTALVGAYNKNSSQGRAYVFTRSGTSWSLQQELTAGDAANGDGFGYAVALSSDGSTALVGAVGKNISEGTVYAFTRAGTSWSQQQELTASDGANFTQFGSSVALSGDGNTALIGARGNNSPGAAYVFTRAGTNWNQQQELTASDAVKYDLFGTSVALASDGNTALVGASGKNTASGAAYVFTRTGANWNQQQELAASDAAQVDNFGSSVALSGDGNIALVGAYKKAQQGAGYVFARTGTNWNQQQKLTAKDAANNDYFGWSVALSSNGNLALVGAYDKNSAQGTGYVFTRTGDGLIQLQELTASDAVNGDNFGYAVALSSDGNTALAGATGKNSGKGAAYVFTPPTPGTSVTVGTNISGAAFTVDGNFYTSTQTFTWTPGDTHTIAVTSPQSPAAGTEYAFNNWSDGNFSLSETITVGSSAAIYTANFSTLYLLTVNANTGGTASGGGYFTAGTVVPVTATPNTGYVFGGWSGPVAAVNSASTTVMMPGAPLTLTASFTAPTAPTITFATVAPGTALGSATLSATTNSTAPVSFASTTPAVCTVSGSSVSYLTGGTCTLTASVVATGVYSALSVSQNVSVGLATPTITFPVIPAGIALGSGSLSATTTSTAAVTFASTTPLVCTVSGSSVSYLTGGTCALTASVVANGAYSALSVSQNVNVRLTTPTITFPTVPAGTALGSGSLSATTTSTAAVSFSSTTPSVCTVSGSSVSYLTSGTCMLTASVPPTSVYQSATATQNVTVNLAVPSLTFTPLGTQTAGGTATLSATTTSTSTVSFASTTPTVCAVSGTTVSFLIGGTCTLTASVPATAVYQSATATQNLTVKLAVPSLTFTPLGTQTAGGTATLSATTTSTSTVSFASTTPTVCAVSGTTVSFLIGGTCTLTASVPATSVYQSATATQNVTVNLAVPSLTFTPLGTQTAGGTAMLSATTTSTSTVSFASTTSTVCTVSGTTVSFLIGGTCTLTASVPATAVYQSATATQNLTVKLAVPTISFTALGAQTATGTATLSATTNSNGAVTFASTTPAVCTVSGTTVSFLMAGSCTLTASVPATPVYQSATAAQSVTVSLATQTLTFSPLSAQTTATTATLHATSTSNGAITFTSTTPTVCTVSSVTASFLIAGTCTLTASVPATPVYQSATVTQSVTVNLATQTLTFSPLSAQVTATTATLHATSTSNGAITFASTTPTVCTVSGATATFLIGGTCTLTASVPATSVYQSATGAQSITVNMAVPTLTFTALGVQTAGGTAALSATTNSNGAISFASATPAVCTVSGAKVSFLIAGTCTLTASVPATSIYQGATVSQNLTVNLAPQTITFSKIPASQLQGALLTLTATASSGLPVSFVSMTPSVCTVSGNTTTLANPGTCTVQASQPGSAVYAAAPSVSQSISVTAAFTITPNPPSETVFRGGIAAFVLQLQAASGFNGSVMLTCSGGPAGSSCVDFPMTVYFTNGQALAVSGILFPANTAPGTYTVTFTGVSGSITDAAKATFIVKAL